MDASSRVHHLEVWGSAWLTPTVAVILCVASVVACCVGAASAWAEPARAGEVADALELIGRVGGGGPLDEALSPRGWIGLGLQWLSADLILLGLDVEGSMTADDRNPEAVEVIGALSVAPVVGLRVTSGAARLDGRASLGWVHRLGELPAGVAADAWRLRLMGELSGEVGRPFGHAFYLGLWLGVDLPEGQGRALIGGISLGGAMFMDPR